MNKNCKLAKGGHIKHSYLLKSCWGVTNNDAREKMTSFFTCPSITPSKACSIHCTGSIKYDVHWTSPEQQHIERLQVQ